MNFKLSRLERWVRFFLGLQAGAGAGMLWNLWPEASWGLAVLGIFLLFSSAIGIRPLNALAAFFIDSGADSTPDAA